MPISAAGRARIVRPCPKRTARTNGFTLVELMVVLVILGLASASVVLAMPDPGGGLVGEGQRFAARARAAQERAIMDNRAFALRFGAGGYGFERSQAGEWHVLEERPFATARWSEGVAVAPGRGRIVFDSTGFTEPARVVLTRGREQVTVDIGQGGEIDVRP